jgi:hypothetical protein
MTSVWGPIAWKLLHGMGARAGKGPEKLKKDEQREILWLLKNLESIIPCEECRKHIGFYKKDSFPKSSEEVGAWIWTFHEAVNERLGKPEGPPFTKILGEATDIRETWKEYNEILKKELLLGNCRSELVGGWRRHFQLWITFL